jgi:hypothetical protein
MRSFSFAALALAGLLAVPDHAVAQEGQEASLVLTILGGTVTGHSLWTVEKQPLCVGAAACSGVYDTLRLSRSITSATVFGAAATFFPSRHLGLHAEISYLGLPIDSECTGFFNPDTEQRNEQICDNIAAQSAQGGAISIFGGVTVRVASRRAFSPYVRGNLGIVNQSRSTVEVEGGYIESSGQFFQRQVIDDPNPRHTSFMVGLGLGFTTAIGTGYQFRLEGRDVITSLVRLVGPANALGIGPTATRAYHHFSLVLGLDVVLEKRRGRRY